jgi:membrane fusion protein (multidrug efflux system)
MIRKTLIILLTIVAITSVILVLQNKWKAEVFVTKARVGEITDSVSGNVRVLADSSYDLRSRTQGMVTKVALLPFGKQIEVDANETLVQLDTDDLKRQLRQTLLSKKNYDERRNSTQPTAIQLELEEKTLKDLVILARERKISSLDLETKQNLVQKLRAQLKQEELDLNEEGNRLQTTLENIEAQLQRTIVKSPISGEFVSSSVAPGDIVFEGQVLGRINSHTRLIEVSLNEEDFAGMKEGLPAGVSLFSFGSRVFEAKVDRLSFLVEPKTGRRKLYLKLDSKRKLPTGGAGRAEIIKRVRKQTLIIPRKSLVGNLVFVEKNGLIEIREVQTGARNLNEVEITKGLKEGDHVVTRTPHLFHSGQRVKSSLVESSVK